MSENQSTFVPTEGTTTVAAIDGAEATLVIKDEPQAIAADQGAPPVHRKTARLASRLGTSLANAAALASVEAGRVKLADAPAVLYYARKGEYGYCGPGVPPAPIACAVRVAHNDEVCDLVAVDEDGFEHELASCTRAGSRDTKVGDPGTFEVVG